MSRYEGASAVPPERQRRAAQFMLCNPPDFERLAEHMGVSVTLAFIYRNAGLEWCKTNLSPDLPTYKNAILWLTHTTPTTMIQKLYDDLTTAKEKLAILTATAREDLERYEPYSSAKEEVDNANELAKAEKKQWEAAHADLLDNIKEARKEVKEAKEALKDAALLALVRGEAPSIIDKKAKRPVQLSFSVLTKVSDEGSTSDTETSTVDA